MAVSTLPRFRVNVRHQPATVPPLVLITTLIAPAVDLLGLVQPMDRVPVVALAATSVATIALLLTWLRFPLVSWLAAATLAAGASLVLRVTGGEGAPLLMLLAIIGLGAGGAFASSPSQTEAVLQ
jgi:hypothetical protein